MQRALDGVQPAAQALGDGVVLAFLGQGQRGIALVFRLGLHFRLAVVLSGGLRLLKQPEHVVALGGEQAPGPVLVHPAVLLVRVGCVRVGCVRMPVLVPVVPVVVVHVMVVVVPVVVVPGVVVLVVAVG